jgi:hypothetical protein
MARKGDKKTTGSPGDHVTNAGKPREDFIGNLTVPMANFLRSSRTGSDRGLSVSEFRNTNIVGDGGMWSNVLLPDTVNVGLIGDYSVDILVGRFQGVTDILGPAPRIIGQGINLKTGYLNLWDNVSHHTIVGKFDILRVRETGGGNILAGDPDPSIRVSFVVYDKRYESFISGAETSRPNHRAFMVGYVAKLTGDEIPSGVNQAAYQGRLQNSPVPSYVEEDWIKFGNGATTGFSPGVIYANGIPQLAESYATLLPEYKITQEEFDALP